VSILVRHGMTEDPKTLLPDMTAADAAGLMASHDIGAVPVAGSDGTLLGLVTDRDIVLRVVAAGRNPRTTPVSEVATDKLITISPDEQISEARSLMAEHRIRRLPVVKSDRLVGILSLGDVAWADASARASGETLKAVSESESTTSVNEGPDKGTPERVRRAAGT
jgi:CBS domain-containing protein